jgi:thiamine-phosphate pyrophosphorylase
MITDRRRLGAGWEAALIERIGAAARAGVHLIQLRERDLDARSLTRLAAQAVEAVQGTTSRVLVNDRVDIAVAAGAHGVHLRGDSVSARRVRAIAPAWFVVGRSVHSRQEMERADEEGGLDYVLFGTVFETVSKPGVAAAGVEALRVVVAATTIPVLGIGGITAARAGEVAGAGAAGMAAIGLFADGPPEHLQVTARQAALAFDTLGTVP